MVGKVLQVFKTFKYGRLCAPAITKNKQNKNFEVSTMFYFGFNLQIFLSCRFMQHRQRIFWFREGRFMSDTRINIKPVCIESEL